jgi:ubiquinone/menaquinone biosynthesis C-methylase UbiE
VREARNQDTQFDGSIPEVYDRFLGPLFFEQYAQDVARRVSELGPKNVLEVAAGTGIVTRRLLEILPQRGTLTVTDLNPPMLYYNRAKFGNEPRVSWRQADALNLPFEDGEFDIVVCQFGLMFFPDKLQGMREFRRVLSADGTLLVSVWDSFEHNPAQAIIHEILIDAFPVDPPDFYQVPLGYHDVTELRRVATAAGFTDVRIETLVLDGTSPSASEAAIGLVRGNPVVNMIRERAPGRQAEIEDRTKERLEERFGLGPLNVPTQAHLMTASAPKLSREIKNK